MNETIVYVFAYIFLIFKFLTYTPKINKQNICYNGQKNVMSKEIKSLKNLRLMETLAGYY